MAGEITLIAALCAYILILFPKNRASALIIALAVDAAVAAAIIAGGAGAEAAAMFGIPAACASAAVFFLPGGVGRTRVESALKYLLPAVLCAGTAVLFLFAVPQAWPELAQRGSPRHIAAAVFIVFAVTGFFAVRGRGE